jgi:hypothetical protein
MRSAACAAAVAALLLVSGCASTAAGPAASREPEPELSVSLVQNRSDLPVGRLQLRVTNGSDADLRVDTATLDSTLLAQPAVWDQGTIIPAGGTRDLPVRFPAASCTDRDPDTVVRLEGETPAGDWTIEVTPADPHERMPLLTGADCFAQEVAAVGEVSIVGLSAEDPAEPAELELRVDSAGGDGTLHIRSMGSTVLFNAVDADGRPTTSGPVSLELGPGEPSATARVPIVPNRCDPHALAEDKVGTLFVFAAEVVGGRSGPLSLPASPELRAELYAYLSRACAL